jgi:hypothetical protein
MKLKELVELAIERGWTDGYDELKVITTDHYCYQDRVVVTFNGLTRPFKEGVGTAITCYRLSFAELITNKGFMTALFGEGWMCTANIERGDLCIHSGPLCKSCNLYTPAYLYHSQKAASLVILKGSEKAIEYLGEVCGE